MSNTRKDYQRAAEIVRAYRATDQERIPMGAIIESAFVQFFKDENPRFDEVRFRAACKCNPLPLETT